MELDIYQFIAGFNSALNKTANEEAEPNIFDVKGSLFPTTNTQSKWRFARSENHLQLNDGNTIYAFHLPEGEKDYDFPMTKLETTNPYEFGKDASSHGTAQVHRADPGSIYFTIQDGKKNPTYTFKHIEGSQWRAMPKVKHHIDANNFIKGAEDAANDPGLLDQIFHGVEQTGRGLIRGTMALGHDPVASTAAGLLGGAAYDFGKRSLYNTEEENQEETVMDRLKRYLIPAAGLGLTGLAAKNTFPNYYSHFPEYRP